MSHAAARPGTFLDKRFAVRLEEGVVFGSGRVGFTRPDGSGSRPLLLDVYSPEDDDDIAARPTLIMAFGGAFHRGSRTDDQVIEGGAANTPVATYCREFARRGYVCFSIDYRLVTEDPDPGVTPVVADPASVPRSRVDVVRERLGLPVASTDMLWRGVEAGADDFALAFRFVAANAQRWRVDSRRMAVGGFSAGARSAWNAAYAEGIPAAAVVSISGTMDPSDFERSLRAGARTPLLLVRGEHDLDYVRDQNPKNAALCVRFGVDAQETIVCGAGHFYPASAQVAHGEGPTATLEDTIALFLAERLGQARES